MFSKLADTVIKHSKAIIALWVVVLCCALPFGLKSNDVLVYDMNELPGSSNEASEGQDIINEYFTNTIDLSEILVISYDNAEEAALTSAVYSEFASRMSAELGDKGFTVSDYGSYSKGSSGYPGIELIAIGCTDKDYDVVDETENIRDIVKDSVDAVSGAGALKTYVTGNDALTHDTMTSSTEDVSKIDPMSIVLIFVLLGLFFYAIVTAIIPPAVVGMSYGIVLLLLYVIGNMVGIFYITQILILVVMLGAGCDYAIFIMTRYRDERKIGKDHQTALREAVMWGGESVFTSGVSVVIGFACLAICDYSLVRTMGIILALSIVVALFAALTFIPSLVNLLGEKIFWPNAIKKYQDNEANVKKGKIRGLHAHLSSMSKRYFTWLSRNTHKYAAPIVAVLLVVAVPSVWYFFESEDSADLISVEPDSESMDGLNAIMDVADGGMIMPTYVVLDLNQSAVQSISTSSDDYAYAVLDTAGHLATDAYGNPIRLPYLVWSSAGLTVDSATMSASGTVVDIMTMTNQIQSKYSSIIGSASGLNSWTVLYATAASQIAAAGETPTPALVNATLVGMMPSAVHDPIARLVGAGSSYNTMDPTQTVAVTMSGTTVTGTITVSNIIDYILNYATGILSADGSHVSIMIVTNEKPMSANTMDFVNDLLGDMHSGDSSYDSVYASDWSASYVSGTSASMQFIMDDVEEQFDFIRVVVAVLLICLLFFILGSYLTPIRAILTILLSVIITVVLTRIVFSDILDTPVIWLVPIVLFVVLLGLGMDYEIFMTTKIRENKIRGMSNDAAIDSAIRTTGPVISLCALIMGGTFLTLLIANSSMLREFGFALGFGIIIDGLLMVGYVSPALMHLMGRWSWKGPGFLTRKHGINPDGTNLNPVPSGTVDPQTGDVITSDEDVKNFKEETVRGVAEREQKLDALKAEIKPLRDDARIGRLDEEGQALLSQKEKELSEAKREFKAYWKGRREERYKMLGIQ